MLNPHQNKDFAPQEATRHVSGVELAFGPQERGEVVSEDGNLACTKPLPFQKSLVCRRDSNIMHVRVSIPVQGDRAQQGTADGVLEPREVPRLLWEWCRSPLYFRPLADGMLESICIVAARVLATFIKLSAGLVGVCHVHRKTKHTASATASRNSISKPPSSSTASMKTTRDGATLTTLSKRMR